METKECVVCYKEIDDSVIYECSDCGAVVCDECYLSGNMSCPECGGDLAVIDREEEEDY